MATTYSDLLRVTKQDVGENVDTWGLILNEQVFELLEDAIAGRVSVTITAGDVTLTTANGANDQARYAIVQVNGDSGAPREVIVPDLNKLYLIFNNTSGALTTVTVKTAAGSGIEVPQNRLMWVFCNGVSVRGVTHALTAVDATNVTTTIDAIAISLYGRRDVQQNWQKSQATSTFNLTDDVTIIVNLESSNKFRVQLGGNRTLANPTNTLNGISFEILVVQDGAGSRTLAYQGKYRWPAGVTPTLTTTPGRADLLTFSYDNATDRYLGSIVQNYNL